MSAATELWTKVTEAYDSAGLISLTNIRDRTATTVNTSVGQQAAQDVIYLWPQYAQEEYDSTDNAQVLLAAMAVIALLWRRGGSSTSIAKVEWEEVFGPDGLIANFKQTNARARSSPSTNSGVTQKAETDGRGGNVRGWADRESLPQGILPTRRSASYEE
jgi:hypothetical protein